MVLSVVFLFWKQKRSEAKDLSECSGGHTVDGRHPKLTTWDGAKTL